MSRRHFRDRRFRGRGPIKRVTRGLADAFGIPRGAVIAGFVLGFVFFPLLSLLAFLAAWYWVNDPERTRRHADSLFDSIRRMGDRFGRGAAEPRVRGVAGGTERESPEAARSPVYPTALVRRFERIERRARVIEEFVASEEFRLNREFRRMERE